MMSLKYDFNQEFRKRYQNNSNYHQLVKFMESDKNEIGNKFLSFRVSNNLSQKDAAKYLKIKTLDYIKIESGTNNYTVKNLQEYLENLKKINNKFLSFSLWLNDDKTSMLNKNLNSSKNGFTPVKHNKTNAARNSIEAVFTRSEVEKNYAANYVLKVSMI